MRPKFEKNFYFEIRKNGETWSSGLMTEAEAELYRRHGYEVRKISFDRHVNIERAAGMAAGEAWNKCNVRNFNAESYIKERPADPNIKYLELFGISQAPGLAPNFYPSAGK